MKNRPDVAEIRKRLEFLKVPDSFVTEAYRVCDEAEKNSVNLSWKDPRAILDFEYQAQLRFIEAVLNG